MKEAEPSSGSTGPAGGIRKIAVVAVHGVGDHPQYATAREIGDLLSNLEYKPHNSPRYAPFTEVVKRINVRPVKVPAETCPIWTNAAMQQGTWGPMHALAKAVDGGKAALCRPHEGDNQADSLDHLFMQGQLFEYKGEKPEDTYQCLRLEGRRVPPVAPQQGQRPGPPEPDTAGEMASDLRRSGVELPPSPAAGTAAEPGAPGTQEKIVHLYEMYWSDLSQLGNAFTRIFGELYQLLFHLGSVSVNNVLAASMHFHGVKGAGEKWGRFATAQGFAAAVLAWPIPILNLLMAAVVPVILILALMRTYLSARGEFLALDAFVALLCVAASGYTLSRRPSIPASVYPVPLFLFGALGIAVGVAVSPPSRVATEFAAGLILLVLTLGIVWVIVQAYDKRRPGSKRAALWNFGILLVIVVISFAAGGVPINGSFAYPAIEACLNILEVAFLLLLVSWMIFYAAYVWAHVAGWLAVRSVPQTMGEDRIKAGRTRWTAQLVLALSSLVFITLTIAVWAGIVKVGVNVLPGQKNAPAEDLCTKPDSTWRPPADPCQGETCDPRYHPVSPIVYSFLWRNGIKLFSGSDNEVYNRAQRFTTCAPLVSSFSVELFQGAGLGFMPIYLIAFVVAFGITIWAFFPSVGAEISPPSGSENLSKEAASMGAWLDRGFGLMRFGGEVLYVSLFIPTVLLILLSVGVIPWPKSYMEDVGELLAVLGTLVAGAAVGVFGFAGRLKSLAGGLRPLLRVMLDVDNWLREHPRDSNPTARICGRYVSLLRLISGWKDTNGHGYDAVVFIAHSQGTVITADFLRFLKAETEQAGSIDLYDPELRGFASMPKFLFTMGCPLHQLYGLRFPFLYGWARNNIGDSAPAPSKVPDIGDDEAPRPDRLGVDRWLNAYRSGDYIGRYLWRGGKDATYLWGPAHTTYDQEWDPPAGKPECVSADKPGHRIEFSIGPGAHTHYWDHTGALIAEVLDRIINSA